MESSTVTEVCGMSFCNNETKIFPHFLTFDTTPPKHRDSIVYRLAKFAEYSTHLRNRNMLIVKDKAAFTQAVRARCSRLTCL